MITDTDEIEEGEIPQEEDEEEEDEDEEEEMFIDEDAGIDLVDILTTPEGDTVCSALVGLVQQMQMQNKILIKMLGKLA